MKPFRWIKRTLLLDLILLFALSRRKGLRSESCITDTPVCFMLNFNFWIALTSVVTCAVWTPVVINPHHVCVSHLWTQCELQNFSDAGFMNAQLVKNKCWPVANKTYMKPRHLYSGSQTVCFKFNSEKLRLTLATEDSVFQQH